MSRIHLSKADVTEVEESCVLEAIRSGWVAPLGPAVDAFEAEMAARAQVGLEGVHIGDRRAAPRAAGARCRAGHRGHRAEHDLRRLGQPGRLYRR